MGSLDGGEPRLLVHSLAGAGYASGFLLYLQDANLVAQKLNMDKLALTGESRTVAPNVIFDLSTWHAVFATADNGVLAYQTGNFQGGNQLTWYDRSGKLLQLVGERGMYQTLKLSPDGRRLAVSEGSVAANISIYDLGKQASMRLTFGAGEGDTSPVWSPDGQWVAYGKHPSGSNYAMYRKRANGSGVQEELSKFSRDRIPLSWSSDGRHLLYSEGTLGSGDIGALPLSEDRQPFLIVRAGVDSYNGQFSPDGRWVSYCSVQGGDQQVYVTSFPDQYVARHEQGLYRAALEPEWAGDFLHFI